MVLENPLPPFSKWIWPDPPILFLMTTAVLICLAIVVTYLRLAIRLGPVLAFGGTGQAISTAAFELSHVSSRRVYALARLAFQESLRRKVLVAFIVFTLVMLLAGWFLDVKSDHPAQLYLAFVLWATNILIIVLAAVLSTMSLPADFKNNTIFTVVTKPVYAWEIVLGRIFGFAAIGTVLLLAMALVSYFFVVRGLNHRHEIDPAAVATLQAAEQEDAESQPVYTSSGAHHRHELYLDSEGRLQCREDHDHVHEIEQIGEGENVEYRLGPPRGGLQARVATLGNLRFYDAQGKPSQRGINVGKEWDYQSFIEGGTDAAAVWTFEGVTEEDFEGGLPLDMTIRVFRTHKGEIERQILGEIFLARPNPENPFRPLVASVPLMFESNEFTVQPHFMPRQQRMRMRDGTTVPIDLFDDGAKFPSLVDDKGRVEVWLRCAEPQQYFGMARPDLYVKKADSSFELNFAKGYMSLWFQMVLVITFGVMFSTFLNAPVALLATAACCLLGFVNTFVYDVAGGENEGGGPLEAMIRLVTHQNMTSELQQSEEATTIIESVDGGMLVLLVSGTHMVPDFKMFRTSHLLASGYNIPNGYMGIYAVVTLAFLLGVSIAGYVFLRAREIAA